MRRSLRRAGWALAAAGGLGLSGSALAQSNPVHFIGPAGHASTVEPPSVMNEGQARYEESQVELAWLAEPIISGFFIEPVAGRTLASFKGHFETP